MKSSFSGFISRQVQKKESIKLKMCHYNLTKLTFREGRKKKNIQALWHNIKKYNLHVFAEERGNGTEEIF